MGRVSRLRWLARSGTGKNVARCPQDINKPELPSLADAVTGCISHPTVKSALMCWQDTFQESCPGLAKLVLAVGLTAGGRTLLKTVLTRLRQHHLPASTAEWLPLICMRWRWHSCADINYLTH